MEAMTWVAVGAFFLSAVTVAAVAGLKAWHGWLELKRLELACRTASPTGDRIELADLRERVRKLEAIAACVDI